LAEQGSSDMRFLFEPRSVAVIGASRNPAKFGHVQLRNLMELGFQGEVYPVNPNANHVLGLKAYRSVRETPVPIDLAVITIPAPKVPEAVEDCAEKSVKVVVITSSGFGEVGGEGIGRERLVIQIAKKAGMRIVGPNTTGIVNTANNFTTSFISLPKLKRGPVAFIAQTGLFAAASLWHMLTAERFGVSKVAGLGNKADVNDQDVLQYLASDPETRVVAIYMEGVKDGRGFVKVAREVSKRKPVILLKGACTPEGARAAASHTASIAVRDDVFEAACRSARILRARSFEEMMDLAKIFAYQPPPRGRRLTVVTFTGAGGVMASDRAAQEGLELSELSPEIVDLLQAKMPPWARAGNPVDAEPLFETLGPDASLRFALDTISKDGHVDMVALFIVALPQFQFDLTRTIAEIREKLATANKPIAVHITGMKELVAEATDLLEENRIPVYPSIERAVTSLAATYRYAHGHRVQ